MKKIASLFLIFATVLMLSACSASKPEDVAKEFVEASYKGDADKMLSLIHFPEEEKAKPGVEEMVSGKIKGAAGKAKERAERKGGVKEVTVLESKMDEANGLGMVKIQTTFKNDGSESEKDSVKLIKSDDKWQVRL